MKNNMRGFTLVEAIVCATIVIVALVLIGSLVFKGAGCLSSNDSAPAAAKEWGARMGLQVQGVDCVNYDTDGDGYVSCSVSVKRTDGSVEIMPVECASNWSMNDGCRMPKVMIR